MKKRMQKTKKKSMRNNLKIGFDDRFIVNLCCLINLTLQHPKFGD